MKRVTVQIPPDVDVTAHVEHIKRECRLNDYKVVDYDLDDYSEHRYVVVQKVTRAKHKPKRRFIQ